MASILAIVSKKVFERDFRAGLGDVVATDHYASTHPSFDKLTSGGNLYLVTVAAGEQLWLAGVLASPKLAKDRWTAAPNATPITDITSLIPQIAFDNGKGITAKPGALAMSLQTPRTLSAADVELLDAAAGGGAKPVKLAAKSVKSSTSKKAATASKPTRAAKPSRAASGIAASPELGLAKVQADLAAGAYAAALDGLVHAWERCRAAELADLIDELGAWACKRLPPIQGNKKTIDAAFSDVADLMRTVDVPRLAVALELGSSPQVAAWLDILDRFPIDPRLCAPAIALCTKYVASSAGPSRTRAFRMAEKIADGRCIPQIEKLLKRDRDAWNWTELKDRIRKMLAKLAPPPALPAGEKAAVAAIEKLVAKLVKQPPPDEATLFSPAAKSTKTAATGEQLLAEVLANPDHDAPRLVYADYLQQHGNDPRGELIALQMQPERTPAQRDRIDKLVKSKANVTRWLGPLAAVVTDPVFERGFLHACTIELKTAKHRELLSHPLWSTVREAHCEDIAVLEKLRVRKLGGPKIADLAALVTRKTPLHVEELADLAFDVVDDDSLAPWEELGRIGAFEKLRALGLCVGWRTVASRGIERDGFAWLFDSKLGKQLEGVAIDYRGRAPQIATWLRIFDTHAKLARLELRCNVTRYATTTNTSFAVIAKRRDGDRMLALELQLDRIFDGNHLRFEISTLPGLLTGLPTKQTSDTLEVEVRSEATQKQLDLLQAHLETTLGNQFTDITVTG